MPNGILYPCGKEAGGYGNEVLYRMCADKPEHTDQRIVGDKIWIIGRAYACDVQRQAKKQSTGSENFYSEIVAPAICCKSADGNIDVWLEKIPNYIKLTKENLKQSLECHKNVVKLLEPVTRNEKLSLTSFVSKYLHFHKPDAFFIYDSRAKRNVRKEIKQLIKQSPDEKPDFDSLIKIGFDDEYAAFCTRCIYYRDKLEANGTEITPRMLDMKLLNYGGYWEH